MPGDVEDIEATPPVLESEFVSADDKEDGSIAKQALMAYQLMQECCAATTVAELRGVVERCVKYQADGDFVYDGLKVISQQFTLLEQIEERGAVG